MVMDSREEKIASKYVVIASRFDLTLIFFLKVRNLANVLIVTRIRIGFGRNKDP